MCCYIYIKNIHACIHPNIHRYLYWGPRSVNVFSRCTQKLIFSRTEKTLTPLSVFCKVCDNENVIESFSFWDIIVFNQWFFTHSVIKAYDYDLFILFKSHLLIFFSFPFSSPNYTDEEGLVYPLETLNSRFVWRHYAKGRTICFRDVFNNSAVLDMDETGSSILFKSGRQ